MMVPLGCPPVNNHLKYEPENVLLILKDIHQPLKQRLII